MKRLLVSAALCALSAPVIVSPAHGQFPGGGIVYDPANHVENIITAARSVEQIRNQIAQLTHEIEMLENMARNLESLDLELAEAIIADRVRRISELMREAEGIGYGVEDIEREYERLYPESHGETPPRQAVLVRQARQRWQQSRTAYRDTLTTSALILEDNAADARAIGQLVEESQGSVGALQTSQAGNQLQGLTIAQLMQMETMMAAFYRAEALKEARQLAEAERGRARTRSFLAD
ncbi:MAG: P-type conjugative transfer protein TrbJ [Alphaproteobacteria bacterium]|jgi:P-type conjugative transfer protein TrbJ|nr:P-type conjugative transfer protein TrbJ [Alphaproteobacteria bacterium]